MIQYNEYYQFGLQTPSSWTRDGSKNDFLYNAGNELNSNTQWYETFFRGYDPALGKFLQVDPKADKYGSLTTYNYAGNNPVVFNDPLGDDLEINIDWDQIPDGETMVYQDASAGMNSDNGFANMFGGAENAFQVADAMHDALNGRYNALWNSMCYGSRMGANGATDRGTLYGYKPAGHWVSVYSHTVLGDVSSNDPSKYFKDVYAEVWVTDPNDISANLSFTGTAPYSLYNGALRMFYQYRADALKELATDGLGNINYEKGKLMRLALKSQIRSLTFGPHRYVLNKIDPIAPSSKSMPRFWKTNTGWNIAGKLSTAGGLFSIGVAYYRISTAENKIHETGKVVSGFAGASAGMWAVAPIAAAAGAVSGPFAPFVSGGILFVGGVAGAVGAEWLYDEVTEP